MVSSYMNERVKIFAHLGRMGREIWTLAIHQLSEALITPLGRPRRTAEAAIIRNLRIRATTR